MIPELVFLHFDPCCIPTPRLSPPAHCLPFSLLRSVAHPGSGTPVSMWDGPGQTPEVGGAMHHRASALGLPKVGALLHSCFSSVFVSGRVKLGIWAEVDGQCDGEREPAHTG